MVPLATVAWRKRSPSEKVSKRHFWILVKVISDRKSLWSVLCAAMYKGSHSIIVGVPPFNCTESLEKFSAQIHSSCIDRMSSNPRCTVRYRIWKCRLFWLRWWSDWSGPLEWMVPLVYFVWRRSSPSLEGVSLPETAVPSHNNNFWQRQFYLKILFDQHFVPHCIRKYIQEF